MQMGGRLRNGFGRCEPTEKVANRTGKRMHSHGTRYGARAEDNDRRGLMRLLRRPSKSRLIESLQAAQDAVHLLL